MAGKSASHIGSLHVPSYKALQSSRKPGKTRGGLTRGLQVCSFYTEASVQWLTAKMRHVPLPEYLPTFGTHLLSTVRLGGRRTQSWGRLIMLQLQNSAESNQKDIFELLILTPA